jgi:hypothetical protein
MDNSKSKLVNLDDIVVEGTIEVGKKFHKVHNHLLISISHNSILQFDRHLLQSYLEKNVKFERHSH